MIKNQYSEIQIALFPVQSGFTCRDNDALDRLLAGVNDALHKSGLRALYRTPAPRDPIASLQLNARSTDTDNYQIPHAKGVAVRSAFLDLPWVGEVEVLGICRL